MASIQKQGQRWRAQIERKGVRKSKVFPTRQEARDWAAREEMLIVGGARALAALTFRDLLDRYARDVSPSKRGERWEVLRLRKIGREPIADKRLSELSARDLAAWRDKRLTEVSPGSVRREMQLLSSVFSIAVQEWELLPASPMQGVRMPPPGRARDRLPTEDELARLEAAAGPLTSASGRAFHAFRFSMETAMRAGEICGLTWANVDKVRRVAHLPITKNGDARDVPLSTAAVALLEELPENDPVFGMKAAALDANWRKLKAKAGVEGLTFHDARHYAVTHLARRLNVLELARVVGHRNIAMLQRYYNESAADLAKRLG